MAVYVYEKPKLTYQSLEGDFAVGGATTPIIVALVMPLPPIVANVNPGFALVTNLN